MRLWAPGRAGRYARAAVRWARLLRPGRTRPGLRVAFGQDRLPTVDEPVGGGNVKYQRLAARFPRDEGDFTVLYLGSSGLPRDLRPLLWIARRRGAPLVLNQDGVAYPAWAGDTWEERNHRNRAALRAAEHVLYQSAFAKADADEYLGAAPGTWELLPNAVDVDRFHPADTPPAGPLTLLLGGDQVSPLRLDLGVRTFALVRDRHPGARLLVTGRLPAGGSRVISEAGVADSVDLVGRFTQLEAPALYRRAHLLLHTKVLDPCPNVVLEALASGLPVVHPASGGTPELVGDAGIAVEHVVDRLQVVQPSPEAMADAIDAALADRDRLSRLGRDRAVSEFPLDRWLDRHTELFAELLARRPAR